MFVVAHHLERLVRPPNHCLPHLLQLLWVFSPLPSLFFRVQWVRIVNFSSQMLGWRYSVCLRQHLTCSEGSRYSQYTQVGPRRKFVTCVPGSFWSCGTIWMPEAKRGDHFQHIPGKPAGGIASTAEKDWEEYLQPLPMTATLLLL